MYPSLEALQRLRRTVDGSVTHAGYAQAGQIRNNIQIPIPNGPNGFVSEFDHSVIENYLEFGI